MCHFQNRGLIILIESMLMLSFSKIKIQKNKKINNIETKGPQWKGRKQGTKVNLGCLLDQAIKEEDKTFYL